MHCDRYFGEFLDTKILRDCILKCSLRLRSEDKSRDTENMYDPSFELHLPFSSTSNDDASATEPTRRLCNTKRKKKCGLYFLWTWEKPRTTGPQFYAKSWFSSCTDSMCTSLLHPLVSCCFQRQPPCTCMEFAFVWYCKPARTGAQLILSAC